MGKRINWIGRNHLVLKLVFFVQALAQIAGVVIDMCRLYQGQRDYIDVLMTMREARDM